MICEGWTKPEHTASSVFSVTVAVWDSETPTRWQLCKDCLKDCQALNGDRVEVGEELYSYIAVDLDGTLAVYDQWRGIQHIGEPVPAMMQRVKAWLTEGQRVKIFTARASEPGAIPYVKAWLEKHGLGELEITNKKDFSMIEFWDDRCVQVEPNTGRRIAGADV